MTNEYRLTDPADREKFYQLYLYAFNRTDSPERRKFFFDRFDHGWIYGLHHGDQLVSELYSLPFSVKLHGVTYKMNGIGDVMSAPEYSGRGGAGTLLKASLEEMLEQKVTLAYLAPFSYEYYRRFGYEQVFNHVEYRLPHANVPRFKAQDNTGSLTRLPFAEAIPLIKKFHAEHPANDLGGMQRPDWWWHYLTLKNDWDVALYRNANQELQGYVLYERDPQAMVVHEWLVRSSAAYENLAAFILRHGNSFPELVFESPNSNYSGDLLANPYAISAKVTPYMMARIVDLADFVKRYPFTAPTLAPVKLAVTDPVLATNQGIWQLSIENGKTSFQKLSDDPQADADLTISIQQLTKPLFGARSLVSELAHAQIKTDYETAKRVDGVLIHDQPQLSDYF